MNSTKKQIATLALLAVVSFAYASACYNIGDGYPCAKENSICYRDITVGGIPMQQSGYVSSVSGISEKCVNSFNHTSGNSTCIEGGTTTRCTVYCTFKAPNVFGPDQYTTNTYNAPTAYLGPEPCEVD